MILRGALARRTLLRLALFFLPPALLLLPGCGEETTAPGTPMCSISAESIDFGTVEGPEPPKTTVMVLRTIRISNAGTASLRGQIGIRLDTSLPDPPVIRLSPDGSATFLLVPPGGSVDITLSATVRASTTGGEHRGTLTLGTTCQPLPIYLNFVSIE